MPAADEIPAPPPSNGDDAMDTDTEEEEVEEEEIIEEVIEEIIEDIEEESGKDCDSEFSDCSNYDREDANQCKNSEGHVTSHIQEEPEANKMLTHSVEGSNENFKFVRTSDEQLKPEKEEFGGNLSNYRHLNSDSHIDNDAHQVILKSATDSEFIISLPSNKTPEDSKLNCGTSYGSSYYEMQVAEIRRQCNVAGNDVAVVVPVSREQPDADALKCMEEIEQVGNVDVRKRTLLRLGDSAVEGWTRSLPFDTGINNGNKRPAIICDFYARGWCIKGSSCRFLHIKDNAKTTAQVAKYTFQPSLSTSERLPSDKTSWLGSSFDSGSSSLKGITSYSQGYLSGSMDFRPSHFLSLHASSSSSIGFEAAKPPLTYAIGGQSCSAEDRTKFIPYNWEPSAPFRPSYFISSIKESTSVSLCKSSGLPNPGDEKYRSCYTQGTSILNAADRIHSNSGTGFAGPECNVDKHSASLNKNNGRVMEKERHTHRIKLPIGVDMEVNSVVDGQSGIAPIEGQPLDFAESHIITHQTDVQGNRNESVTNQDKQKITMASKQKEDVDVQKESEVLLQFRAALIEFVKELVKPIWREGRLSRDAHKIVVKKASDKVISTLQFNQIPAGTESIKLFLSSYRTKIMKLVEGYVDKYGKL